MRRAQIFVIAATAMALFGGCGGASHPTCTQARGTCVPDVPDACAIGIPVPADRYACDAPENTLCCLPQDAGFD